MNLDEFGEQARTSPVLQATYTPEELALIPNRVLAMKVLDRYPEYWDMISPAARKIKEIIARDPEENRYFLGARVGTRITDRARNISNNVAEMNMIYQGDQMMEASAHGVPTTHLGELKLRMFDHESQTRLRQLDSYLRRLEIKCQADEDIRKAQELANIEINKAAELDRIKKQRSIDILEIERLDHEQKKKLQQE